MIGFFKDGGQDWKRVEVIKPGRKTGGGAGGRAWVGEHYYDDC